MEVSGCGLFCCVKLDDVIEFGELSWIDQIRYPAKTKVVWLGESKELGSV